MWFDCFCQFSHASQYPAQNSWKSHKFFVIFIINNPVICINFLYCVFSVSYLFVIFLRVSTVAPTCIDIIYILHVYLSLCVIAIYCKCDSTNKYCLYWYLLIFYYIFYFICCLVFIIIFSGSTTLVNATNHRYYHSRMHFSHK